jgi:hypothetical protein
LGMSSKTAESTSQNTFPATQHSASAGLPERVSRKEIPLRTGNRPLGGERGLHI